MDDKQTRWGIGSRQYPKRPGIPSAPGADWHGPSAADVTPIASGSTGRVTWDRSKVDLDLIPETSTARSLFRFKNALPAFIWNAAALEGNTYTLPEVRTLLDGVTVGGKPVAEAQQIIDLRNGLNVMVEHVHAGTFSLSREISNAVNAQVTKHEIIDPGVFRGEGVVQGGGGTATLANMRDPRERALAYFCSAARSQFYYDGNKRTARIMMTGELMSKGFEAVNVPFARRLEFNIGLESLFLRDDATELMTFLTTCTTQDRG